MGRYKLNTQPKDLLNDNRSLCLLEAFEEVYSYGFDDTPQYGNIIFMLQNELLKMNCIPDKTFSWFQFRYPDNSYAGRATSTLYDDQSEEMPPIEDENLPAPIRIFEANLSILIDQKVNKIHLENQKPRS
jgi:hypothetical protein